MLSNVVLFVKRKDNCRSLVRVVILKLTLFMLQEQQEKGMNAKWDTN